jgi:WD40 repeat protein
MVVPHIEGIVSGLSWMAAPLVPLVNVGPLLATGSDSGAVIVRSATTGEELARWEDEYFVTCLQFSPDNTVLATGSAGECVKLWDLNTLRCKASCEGHGCMVKSISFSPDGRKIASCSSDKTVRLWECETGRQLLCIDEHSDDVNGVCYNSAGTRIASCAHDGACKIWNAVTGEQVAECVGHTDAVWAIRYSPDDEIIATASFDLSSKLFNSESGIEICSLVHLYPVSSVNFSNDGSTLVTACMEGTITIWNVILQQQVLQFRDSQVEKVVGCVFSPDDSEIVCSPNIKFYDTRTGLLTRSFADTSGCIKVAFTRNQYIGIW